MKSNRWRTVANVAFFSIVVSGTTATAHDVVTYENDIKPIFARTCGGGACHIGQSTSGVDLSSYQSTIDSIGALYDGPIVVPGNPDESPLIDKVASDDPRFGSRMPRGADRLADIDIVLMRQWVRDGAQRGHRIQRGDVDGNDERNLGDVVRLLNYLFQSGPAPECDPAADVDANGTLQLTDAVFLLMWLFRGGEEPSPLTQEEDDSCQAAGELSFQNIYESVLGVSCAFSSCHSSETARGDLSFGTLDEAYESLVSMPTFNGVARESGKLRVDPGKPDNSFLLTKLIEPGPGEGNRMPTNTSEPLPDATIAGIREWILFGAPRDGTVPGVPAITDDPPPVVDRVPPPPKPENGFQLHLQPFQVAPRSEREVFSLVDRPFRDHPTAYVDVKRIDVHMTDASHHFILYQFIDGAAKPAPGLRPAESVINVLTSRRLVVGAQQSFFTQSFPHGVGFRFSRDTSFDLNSHYLNLGSEETLQAEVYVNFFFYEPGELEKPVRQIFDINPNINVPPNATRTTTQDFPSFSQAAQDPIGINGSLTRSISVYSLSSHMHRHGTRFTAQIIQGGRPVDADKLLYDNYSWDDPEYLTFDPPLVLTRGQGIRFSTTHEYHDPPSPNSPPLRFGVTSEDEMAILLGYYTVP